MGRSPGLKQQVREGLKARSIDSHIFRYFRSRKTGLARLNAARKAALDPIALK